MASVTRIAQSQPVLSRSAPVLNSVAEWKWRTALAAWKPRAGYEAATTEEVAHTVNAGEPSSNVPRRCMPVAVHTLYANDCIEGLKSLRSE